MPSEQVNTSSLRRLADGYGAGPQARLLRDASFEIDRLRAENEALRKGLSAKELENVLVQADGAFRPGEAVIGPNRASFLAHAVVQALGRGAE